MARILTSEISGTECIGDSRIKINTNFENLDTKLAALSTYTIALDQTLSAYDSNVIDPILTVVRANSASWEESADILPTVTNYLSTNNVRLSSLVVTTTLTANTISTVSGQFNNITASGFVSASNIISRNASISGNISTIGRIISAGQDLYALFRTVAPIPLSGISDVQFYNLSANQVLRFDGVNWKNHNNTAAQQLSGLSDIVIVYPLLSGQVLRHNGTNWYNDFDLADVTDSIRNDIQITNTGSTWTITSGAVTYDKLSNTTSPISANVKSRVAKAWLNYDGVNGIIRSSYNISSVTGLGVGHYKIVYAPGVFTDNNYSFVSTCDETYSAGYIGYYIWSQPTNFTLSSTEVKHRSYAAGTTETNPSILSVVVFASGN